MRHILGLLLTIIAAPVGLTVDKQNLPDLLEIAEPNQLIAGLKNKRLIRKRDPEQYMTAPEIIDYHGYPSEEHKVFTEDGYIVKIHRIPYGKTCRCAPRPPVIVQHGFLCSSAVWVSNTPDKNLAYILADAGYDVWLTNNRGNIYGKNHVNLTVNSDLFWKFSFDQMAKYDMPAFIDYILQKTGHKQCYYIGHSMGTTLLFAMLSSKPEYNSKLRLVMAMAPVAIVNFKNVRSPLRLLAPFSRNRFFFRKLFGKREIIENKKIIKFISRTICRWPSEILCSNLLFIICGYDRKQLNKTRLPVYTHQIPAGSSVQSLEHLAQLVETGVFQKFNYGRDINQQYYGQKNPPKYDLSKITTPIALFFGDNDFWANRRDVAVLATKLKNLVINYRVPYNDFNHMDFIWAIDVKKLLYDKVLEIMGRN